MPFIQLDGGSIHYQLDGAANAPILLLSNSLGTNITLWEKQVPALSRPFRLLRYDSRGHGNSLVSPGPYSLEMLGRDAIALLDRLGIPKVDFCGLSLGGMVGMWLGIHAPERIGRLILANTSPLMAPREAWENRITAVEAGGMDAIVDSVLQRWFTPAFRDNRWSDVQPVRDVFQATSPPGYSACCAAIRDMDQRGELASIRARTLVIGGTHDSSTPPPLCRGIADAIPGAKYVELSAAHLSNIEAAAAFNSAVLDFLIA